MDACTFVYNSREISTSDCSHRSNELKCADYHKTHKQSLIIQEAADYNKNQGNVNVYTSMYTVKYKVCAK